MSMLTMNPTEESRAGFIIDIEILRVWRNVGNDKDFCETGLTVEVTAREQERIAVQVVEHIAMLEAAPELFKDKHILTIVGIKGVLIIRHTVTILIAVLFHHGAGFAGARWRSRRLCSCGSVRTAISTLAFRPLRA